MLRGTLPLRYCTSRFADKVPTGGLPFPGGVALLVGGMSVRSDPSSPDCERIGSGGSGYGYKRFRLRRKNPVHEVFRESFGDLSRPRVWKRLNLGVSLVGEDDDAGRGSCMIILILVVLFMTGRELAKCHGVHEPTPSGLHGF